MTIRNVARREVGVAGSHTSKVNKPVTPYQLGFHMPPEWAPHDGTWMCWPHREDDWPGKLSSVQWAYAEIIRRLASTEKVRIIVQSAGHRERALETLARIGAGTTGLEFYQFSTDRAWIRDNGPIFIQRARPHPKTAIARFRFNGWARYPQWENDDQIPQKIARSLDMDMYPAQCDGHDIVLEGGSIEVNGQGTLLTTEQCLLDRKVQSRNPHLDQQKLEVVLRDCLAVTNVMWLGEGIEGDDTHGHIDDLCRFVDERRVVACREQHTSDPNYRALEENWERLQGMRVEEDAKLDVVALPMPEPVFLDGERLPASYANFYIANDLVLVPTFNDSSDRTALGILAELFPRRTVIGVYALDLLSGGGAIHCITQQQPA